MTLDDLVPHADFSERHQRRIAAPPDAVWNALHELRLGDSWLAQALMGLRALPALLPGRSRPARGMVAGRFLEHGPIPLLATEPQRSVIAGGVLQPWKLRGGDRPPDLDAPGLRSFDRPGWVKCAMDFALEPDGEGTVLRTETRVQATDAATRRRFAPYWLVIRGGSGLIRREMLRLVARRAEASYANAPRDGAREVPTMATVELTAGSVDYEDSGGEGPVLVLLGGVLMDGSVWDPVVADLRRDHRCVVPTLPLGAHRRPMHHDADLSLRGFGTIVAELLERLDLRDVTVVGNDHAAALALAAERPARVARLVVSSCEAFENYPPGLPGRNLRLTALAPGGLFLALQALRLRALRRTPVTFGWMSKRPLPDDLLDRWLAPGQRRRAVRHDLRKYVVGSRRRDMLAVCERLRHFDRPTLVVWTPEDRVQRPAHGRRLAQLLPDARLIEIPDSYTLIMRDQPEPFARAIRSFVADTAPGSASAAPTTAAGRRRGPSR